MIGARCRSLVATLALALATTALACDRAPTPRPHAPVPAAADPAPAPAPAPAQPELEPPLIPDLELPAIAGIQYLEVVTGGASADAELPMIVALHGNGAFPRLMEHALLRNPGTATHPAARFDSPARCIFLRGTQAAQAPGHARWFSITANEAQASPEQLAALSAQIADRSDEVAAAITALAAARPTIGKPIITGHSQGGILVYGLAVRHPELFAAALPVSGWLPKPLWPKHNANADAKGLKLIALHGARDTVVGFDADKAGVEQLIRLGYDVELHTFPDVRHDLSPMLGHLRDQLRDRLADQAAGQAASSAAEPARQ
ncbi:alpha/beta hydrolase [Enhygromyxa salina]|uniref:Putative hydrolase n=1 Tax=Enhygromyxa salina TaxID=215803 RepID=A0A2S9YT94_9BACT|nr:dienelactone hydrolase family protein [Enhygromyxa salina]PRQ08290.1 putative hydrolase [Enhygromyxa salina]